VESDSVKLRESVLAAKYIVGETNSAGAKADCQSFLMKKISLEQLLMYFQEENELVSTLALIERVLEQQPTELIRFALLHERELALQPIEVQELLECSKSERLRWTDEGKLKVLGYQNFKYGNYRAYDLVSTALISGETIAMWRKEHEEKRKIRRIQGGYKAVYSRKENVIKRQIFEIQYLDVIKQWESIAPHAIDTLKLAYWTVWCSHWANKYQRKQARKYVKECINKEDYFYELKNQAIAILIDSPYSYLNLYYPPYFELSEKDERFYEFYCRFSLELVVPGIAESFFFYTSYSGGKEIFPPLHKLEHVHEKQEEGMFKNGFLIAEEFVTHSEEFVLKNLKDALTYFKDFPTLPKKVICLEDFCELAEKRRRQRSQLWDLQLSLPKGISIGDLVEEVISKNPHLSVANIAQEVRKQIKEVAVYSPDGLRELPDFELHVSWLIERQFPDIIAVIAELLL